MEHDRSGSAGDARSDNHDSAATVRPPFRLFESGFASPEEVEAHAGRMVASRKRLEVPASEPGLVCVIHGANEDVLPLGGQDVGRVRHEVSGLFNIAPDAIAMIGGHAVSENHLLGHGETLEFIRPSGRKGVGQVWTKDEFCNLFTMGAADFEVMVSEGLPVHRIKDGSIRITETQVDEFLDGLAGKQSRHLAVPPLPSHPDLSSLIADIRRIADVMDPPPPDIVDSSYVAGRLGCTTTWIADLARQGKIPLGCLVLGTGDGKPWKFHRGAIDAWIAAR